MYTISVDIEIRDEGSYGSSQYTHVERKTMTSGDDLLVRLAQLVEDCQGDTERQAQMRRDAENAVS